MSNRLPHLSGAARLVLAVAAVWLLLAGPAAAWRGPLGLEGLSWAAGICLLPGLCVVGRIVPLQNRPIAGVVGAMGLRLLAVAVAAGVLCSVRPDLRGEAFLVWLVPCYLATLAVETRLLLGEGAASVSTAACRT